MTPERLAELKAVPSSGHPTIPHVAREAIRELALALESERGRLGWMGTTYEAHLHPEVHRLLEGGATGEQLAAAIDAAREREKGADL